MKWYTYQVLMSDEVLVLSISDDGVITSGKPESLPEYQAWIAEGNEPEEWSAE